MRRVVSILTRPEGRVLRYFPGNPKIQRMVVSILTRPEGRVLPLYPFHILNRSIVSILTRPEGRVLQRLASFLAAFGEPPLLMPIV